MLPAKQKLTYFLYVRKSTDVEDKQVLSVAAQITELKEFAARMGIYIVDVIIEKETAKKPGRKKFNKMLERIETGEANGILAWMPDRLSRNSIDSGKIIYMLDQNILLDLKFPHFWFENTPQGKYMLANEFNASKQYVDNLKHDFGNPSSLHGLGIEAEKAVKAARVSAAAAASAKDILMQ